MDERNSRQHLDKYRYCIARGSIDILHRPDPPMIPIADTLSASVFGISLVRAWCKQHESKQWARKSPERSSSGHQANLGGMRILHCTQEKWQE